MASRRMIRPIQGRLVHRLVRHYRQLVYAPARQQRRDFSVAIPFPDPPEPLHSPRIGVVIHLFHADMAPLFRDLIRSAALRADLLMTTDTAEKAEQIGAAFAGYSGGGVDIRLTPNRGRDIQPKLTAFRDRYGDYDLLLFLHGKKSHHMTVGDEWRTFLFDHLAGSPAIVRSIVDIFAANSDVGLVFPQHFEPLRRFVAWGPDGNFAAARQLARRMGIRVRATRPVDFPSGSMFWCRPAALRPLLDLDLSASDFAPEAGQTDGTVAHAVERLFLFAAEKAGFQWMKIAIPSHFSARDQIVRLNDARGVAAFLSKYGCRLMRQDRR
jgi:lipopolysaccharide biosynthesis protein